MTDTKTIELPGIDILNTGHGDFELRFDPAKPEEVEKAKATIKDMLKHGYALFIKEGEEMVRVKKFDAAKNVYIIGDAPPKRVAMAKTRATAVGRSAGG